MWVRDHARETFHDALGVYIDEYAHEFFTKTSALTKQIFPITLDIEHPRWQKGLTKMRHIFTDMEDAERQGGPAGKLKKWAASARAFTCFVGLYTIPVKHNTLPASSRLEPTY